MQPSFALPTLEHELEDPLAHLPYSNIVEYEKGCMIYDPDQRPTGLYLVIDGKVKVSRLADGGHQVVIDIYQRDEFFGEVEKALDLLGGKPFDPQQVTAAEDERGFRGDVH